jgi:hypothetical protein
MKRRSKWTGDLVYSRDGSTSLARQVGGAAGADRHGPKAEIQEYQRSLIESRDNFVWSTNRGSIGKDLEWNNIG